MILPTEDDISPQEKELQRIKEKLKNINNNYNYDINNNIDQYIHKTHYNKAPYHKNIQNMQKNSATNYHHDTMHLSHNATSGGRFKNSEYFIKDYPTNRRNVGYLDYVKLPAGSLSLPFNSTSSSSSSSLLCHIVSVCLFVMMCCTKLF